MPFATLQSKVTNAEFVSPELSTHLNDASENPRAFNSDQGTILVNRHLHLEKLASAELLQKLGGLHNRRRKQTDPNIRGTVR
jgi:hypothetical protein